MNKLKLHLISHTHWDREWYQSFQHYRYRLVRVIDDLLKGLENDENYRVFHMDGQTIVLEDYLAIRPENAERLAKLIRDGRIVIGPWYVMPDEFLISGESLIKNLRMGHKICKDYGVTPMRNGYVTDIFGHNNQFPQILQGFGIDSATLYRGIAEYEKDAFCWRALDGSEVIAAKLEAERSYSNFYFAVRWPYEGKTFDEEDAVQRMKVLVDRARGMAASDMVLMMDGVDHGAMEPRIPEMIRLFEENIPDIEFVHDRIETYFDQLKKESLDVIEGTLYNVGKKGINNQVLKNVLSSMVHIKQANDSCEISLASVAEPLNAFCEMFGDDLKAYKEDDSSLAPRRTYLDTAWKYLITNHPHDSICGCSVSDVHRDNEYRYRQVSQMADISARDCMKVITRNIKCTGVHQEAVLLYNPSQEEVEGVQVFELPVHHHEKPNRRFFDADNAQMKVQVLSEMEESEKNERLRQLIRFDHISILTVAADIKIPAFGYTVIYCDNLEDVFHPENGDYRFEVYNPPCRLIGSQMTAHNRIDNGALTVEINASGLLDVTVHSTGKVYNNLHLLEDRSDAGEGWNWRPVTYDETVYGNNCLKQYKITSDGPLCTVLELTYEMRIPSGLNHNEKERSEREELQQITTRVTIPKDSEKIFFETTLENRIENHRMRVLFPTAMETDYFYTKTPFAMTRWSIAHADTHDYTERDTFVCPSQGVTYLQDSVNQAALYTKGLYEVEVTDNEERAIAVTLFRAAQLETGTLNPEDIKMQRKMKFSYAISFGDRDVTEALVHGEAYRTGICSHAFEQNPQADVLDAGYGLLKVTGNVIVSSVWEEAGKTYVRIFDVSGTDQTAEISFARHIKEAAYVNMNQEQPETIHTDGNIVRVECAHNKIMTIRVEFED